MLFGEAGDLLAHGFFENRIDMGRARQQLIENFNGFAMQPLRSIGVRLFFGKHRGQFSGHDPVFL